jgi:hypothetical protein
LGATLACENCRNPIAKGEEYIWYKVGFRSSYKHVRCLRSACAPRESERESSLMAGVYSASEDAEANIANTTFTPGDYDGFVSELKSHLESAAEGWRDVASQYADAAESMGGAGSNMEETSYSIEGAADELEGWDPDEDEPELDHESHDGYDEAIPNDDCEECIEITDRWVEDTRQSAADYLSEAAGNIEVTYS